MKRAIIYGRTSTTKQSAESIETQIAECRKWAEENDCLIVDIYDDSGQSGRSYNVSNRNGFQQIKEDAKNGKMDYALIHKIDRFARSVADYFIQERELEQYGVKVIVVGMPFFQEADIVFRSLHIAMAEQFSVNLSNDVAVKMRTFAKKKAFLGGRPPYGYKVVGDGKEKTLAIKEEEAEAVRLIYKLYLQGYGYIKIARMIAEKGFVNKNKKPFTPTHIRTVLQNKKYNGYYIFGDMIHRNGKLRKNPDRNSVIEIPDAHPKIIDDRTFFAVQNRIANNDMPRNKTKMRYFPFTGRISCACCGNAMSGNTTSKTTAEQTYRYEYYRCLGQRTDGCKMPNIRADFLENTILEKIQNNVFNDDFVNALISKIEDKLFVGKSSFTASKRDLEKHLARVNEQIKEAMREKFSKRINADLFEEVVEEFSKEKQVIETKIADLERQIHANERRTDIEDYVKWLRNNLVKADNDIKNNILNQVVHSVLVYREKAVVYVHISAPPIVRERNRRGSHNITDGVPLITLDKNAEVHTAHGLDLVKFSIPRKKRG